MGLKAQDVLPSFPSAFGSVELARNAVAATGTDGSASGPTETPYRPACRNGPQNLAIRCIVVHRAGAAKRPLTGAAKTRKTTKNCGKIAISSGFRKRRGRDSNPGYPCGHTGFRDQRTRNATKAGARVCRMAVPMVAPMVAPPKAIH